MAADDATPRVPRALFEGLQLTRRAIWSKEAIRAFWGGALAQTAPEMIAFVERTKQLDAVVYALKDDAHRRRRWSRYCREDLTPRRLLEGLEACHATGSLSREVVAKIQTDYLEHVDANGQWNSKTKGE
jgi:putative hemolysin